MNLSQYVLSACMLMSASVHAAAIDPEIKKEERKQKKYKTFNAVTHEMASYGVQKSTQQDGGSAQERADFVAQLVDHLSAQFEKDTSRWPLVKAHQKLQSWKKQFETVIRNWEVEAQSNAALASYYEKARELLSLLTGMIAYLEDLSEYKTQLQRYTTHLEEQQEQQQSSQSTVIHPPLHPLPYGHLGGMYTPEQRSSQKPSPTAVKPSQSRPAAPQPKPASSQPRLAVPQQKQQPSQKQSNNEQQLNRWEKIMFDQFDPANGY